MLLHAKDSYDYLGGYRNRKLSHLETLGINETYLKVNISAKLFGPWVLTPKLGIVGTNKDCYMLIIGWKEKENGRFEIKLDKIVWLMRQYKKILVDF